jgi:CRISPR-associated endonuclease Csn1
MRLMRNDFVRFINCHETLSLRLCKISGNGALAFALISEANVDARTRTKEISYIFKTAGTLQKANGRRVSISPIGELRDPGFHN